MTLLNKVFPDGIARDLISGGEIDWSKDGELVLMLLSGTVVEFILNLILLKEKISQIEWSRSIGVTYIL